MNAAEQNYSATDKECLALVWGIKTLRPYLLREHFEAHTDNYALKYLLKNTEPSGRLIRWRLALSEFSFTPRYKKGRLNQVAEMMSHLGSDEKEEPDEEADYTDLPCFPDAKEDLLLIDATQSQLEEPMKVCLTEDPPASIPPEELLREQKTDPFCLERLQDLEDP